MLIQARQNASLMEILLTALTGASRTRIRKIIEHRMVTVNGETVLRSDHPVKAGDCIVYEKRQGMDPKAPPPVHFRFEDDHLLVAEKPAGMLTYGDKGTGGTSLYRQIRRYFREATRGRQGLWVVHRLDREVSGLVLFAKSAAIQKFLKDNWKKTHKAYWALVEGVPEKNEGTIRSWLKEGPDRKMRSVAEAEGAKLAVTHFTVSRTWKDRALLEVRLETGRKNQIRIHLSEMGCPVVGDRRYGARADVIRRIRLHAFRLGFHHPVTGRFLEFTSPMPDGFLILKNRDEVYK